MIKKIVLLVSLTLLMLNGYSQRIHTRIGLDGVMDFRLANLPLKVIDPDGDKLNVRSGSAMSTVFHAKDYHGSIGSFFTPNAGVFIMHPQYPLAIRLGCGIENTTFTMEYANVAKERWCWLYSVKPSVDIKIALWDYFSHIATPLVIVGAVYNIPFSAQEGSIGHETAEKEGFAKKGIEGEVGFGLFFFPGFKGHHSESIGKVGFGANSSSKREYGEFSLVYKYYFYNLFDKQYQNASGEFPFAGLTTRYGDIRLRFVIGGFLY